MTRTERYFGVKDLECQWELKYFTPRKAGTIKKMKRSWHKRARAARRLSVDTALDHMLGSTHGAATGHNGQGRTA